MTLKIDNAGRVILPKPVRDRLGLTAGSNLDMRLTPDGIVLTPADQRSSLVKKGSFWVHTGAIPRTYDLLKAIDEEREERTSKAWGL